MTKNFTLPAPIHPGLLICTPTGIAVAPAPLKKTCGKCHDDNKLTTERREKLAGLRGRCVPLVSRTVSSAAHDDPSRRRSLLLGSL